LTAVKYLEDLQSTLIEDRGFNLGTVSEQAIYTALWPARGSGEALVGICGIFVLSKSKSGVRFLHLGMDFEMDDLTL
jgi:hypothetical protein